MRSKKIGLQTCMEAQSEVPTVSLLRSLLLFSLFPPLYSGLGVRRETVTTAGGHECTLRLIPLLRTEVTRQDIGSIIHLTMRQIKQGAEKTQKNPAVGCLREKLRGLGSLQCGRNHTANVVFSIFNHR